MWILSYVILLEQAPKLYLSGTGIGKRLRMKKNCIRVMTRLDYCSEYRHHSMLNI
jgi:hypothetical protein